jgi:hypothetical protein
MTKFHRQFQVRLSTEIDSTSPHKQRCSLNPFTLYIVRRPSANIHKKSDLFLVAFLLCCRVGLLSPVPPCSATRPCPDGFGESSLGILRHLKCVSRQLTQLYLSIADSYLLKGPAHSQVRDLLALHVCPPPRLLRANPGIAQRPLSYQ